MTIGGIVRRRLNTRKLGLTMKEVMKGGSYTTQYQTYSTFKCFDYGSYKFNILDSNIYGYFGNYFLLIAGQEMAPHAGTIISKKAKDISIPSYTPLLQTINENSKV